MFCYCLLILPISVSGASDLIIAGSVTDDSVNRKYLHLKKTKYNIIFLGVNLYLADQMSFDYAMNSSYRQNQRSSYRHTQWIS